MSAVLVSIRLVARLLGLPILRIDGTITLRDESEPVTRRRPVEPGEPPARALPRRPVPALPAGRLLALAEAELAALDGRRNGHPD